MKRILAFVLVVVLVVSMVLPSCTKSTSAYKVATDATWAPFETVNEKTKQIEGFDIDLFNAIADKAGIKITFVNVAFDPLLAGMAQGTYDAAISSITITSRSSKSNAFLRSIF